MVLKWLFLGILVPRVISLELNDRNNRWCLPYLVFLYVLQIYQYKPIPIYNQSSALSECGDDIDK